MESWLLYSLIYFQLLKKCFDCPFPLNWEKCHMRALVILCTSPEVNTSTKPGIVPGIWKVLVNRLIHNHVTSVGRKYASAHQNKIPNKPVSCSVIPTHHFQSGLSHFVCWTVFFFFFLNVEIKSWLQWGRQSSFILQTKHGWAAQKSPLDFAKLWAIWMPAFAGMKRGTRVFSYIDAKVCIALAIIIFKLQEEK